MTTDYFETNGIDWSESGVPVWPCRSVRQLDSDAVDLLGIPPLLLMENAGRSLVDALKTFLLEKSALSGMPERNNPFPGKRFLVLCGKGNNGGDGFVVARRLVLLGAKVHVVTTIPAEQYTGAAAVNLCILTNLASLDEKLSFIGKSVCPAVHRLTLETFQDASFPVAAKGTANDFDWMIDALLGTGATGALRTPYDYLVHWINESGKPVFSIDLPSGLDADTGQAAGEAVHATLTCTLAAYKPGLLLHEAAPFVGRLVCGDIGVPLYG